MDRAAKLAAEAKVCVIDEARYAEAQRRATRDILASKARKFGVPENEISAAVDQALTDAGTTP